MSSLPDYIFTTSNGDELLLTELKAGDEDTYAELLQELDQTDTNGFLSGGESHPDRVAETIEEALGKQTMDVADRDAFTFAVRDPETEEILGVVTYVEKEIGIFEIKAATHPDHQKGGIITAAMATSIIALKEQKVPVQAYYTQALEDNEGSLRLMEKFKFQNAGQTTGADGRTWVQFYSTAGAAFNAAQNLSEEVELA